MFSYSGDDILIILLLVINLLNKIIISYFRPGVDEAITSFLEDLSEFLFLFEDILCDLGAYRFHDSLNKFEDNYSIISRN